MATQRPSTSRPGFTDERRQQFIEDMGLFWEEAGQARMQGRVLGFLMLSSAPRVSSSELCEALHASAGSVSTATRALADTGFIRRVAVAGERSHFFRTDEDVWGAFLAGERKYLEARRRLAETMLEAIDPGDDIVRPRLSNMRDYMSWLTTYHRKMLGDWEEFKRVRDEHPDGFSEG